MNVYEPGSLDDVMLLNWYAQLAASGDLQKLLGPSCWSLSAFCRHFSDPGSVVFYLKDERGWYAVTWVMPLMGGGTWGLWVRDSKRGSGSRDTMDFILATLGMALQQYPVLVNTTKQPEVVAKTCRLGYTYLGCIPALFEGDDCYVLHLTREAFEPVYAKWSAYYERRKDKSS